MDALKNSVVLLLPCLLLPIDGVNEGGQFGSVHLLCGYKGVNQGVARARARVCVCTWTHFFSKVDNVYTDFLFLESLG